ncbi:MAG: 3-oxoacyl-[acyl-carrier protein] reductase, partial [uncultured Acetobacteraceae bacterium]
RGGEGAAGQLHRQPSADARAERHPGERRGAGLHRVPRRLLGAAADQRPEALREHPALHPLRPAGRAGGGGGGGAVPRLAPRAVGDGADHHRGRRPDVGL